MESESRNMQDRTHSNEFKEIFNAQSANLTLGVDKSSGEEKTIYTYACAGCGRIIAKTEAPMDPDGITSKMRIHKCLCPGKIDFENEVR